MKSLTLWALLAVLPTSLLAAPTTKEVNQVAHNEVTSINTLEDVQMALSSHNIVRGQFTQTRIMEMFAQPLVSSGSFLLDKTHGLLWQQTLPFPVELVLTQDKLSQRFANQEPQVITAQENPMAFYFSHIFLSVFHGDTKQLAEQFELTFTTNADHWTIDLSPKQAPLNAVFKQIVLNGNTDIESITLLEVRGDTTSIEFSDHTHQPDTLNDAEQAQFKF